MNSQTKKRRNRCVNCNEVAHHQGMEDEHLCTTCYDEGVMLCKDCLWNVFVPNEKNVGFFSRRCPECQEEYINDGFVEEEK